MSDRTRHAMRFDAEAGMQRRAGDVARAIREQLSGAGQRPLAGNLDTLCGAYVASRRKAQARGAPAVEAVAAAWAQWAAAQSGFGAPEAANDPLYPDAA